MTLSNLIKQVEDLVEVRKGGSGSGNRGHAGVKGHRGGSAPQGGGLSPSQKKVSEQFNKTELENSKKMRDLAFEKVEPAVASWIKNSSNDDLKKSLDSLVKAYSVNQNDKKLYDIMVATVSEDTYRFNSGKYA